MIDWIPKWTKIITQAISVADAVVRDGSMYRLALVIRSARHFRTLRFTKRRSGSANGYKFLYGRSDGPPQGPPSVRNGVCIRPRSVVSSFLQCAGIQIAG